MSSTHTGSGMGEKGIQVKAMCLFQHNGRVLAGKGFDSKRDEHFYRIVGGGMDFFETAEETIRREIQEELGSDIENLKYLTLIENLFEFEGARGHQITFIFSGDLASKALYDQEKIEFLDAPGLFMEWVPIKDIVEKKVVAYPPLDYARFLL